ncbi:MAG: flavodoxin domain-containing protein [Spirochaetia bacterium]
MKTVVIYKSESGFTKKYAKWIAEELAADIFEYSYIKPSDLHYYDVVIFGGSLHAVGINGIDIIKTNLDALEEKKVVVFATGASPKREGILEEVKNKNFTTAEQKRIAFFYLRGGFDYSKLTLKNKLLMNLMKWKIKMKKPEDRTPDEKGMLAAFSQPVDFTKKERAKELIDYVTAKRV